MSHLTQASLPQKCLLLQAAKKDISKFAVGSKIRPDFGEILLSEANFDHHFFAAWSKGTMFEHTGPAKSNRHVLPPLDWFSTMIVHKAWHSNILFSKVELCFSSPCSGAKTPQPCPSSSCTLSSAIFADVVNNSLSKGAKHEPRQYDRDTERDFEQ